MPAKGTIGPLLRLAKEEGWAEHVKSANDEEAVRLGYIWHAATAEHVLGFFPRYLRHSLGEWAGKPFDLLPHQTARIGTIFGWVHRETGLRRFHIAHTELPKKNGKSTEAAGIGLFLFRGDGEPGAHVFSAATKKEQAALVHDEAMRMLQASPELRAGVRINRTTKTLSHEASGSKYAVIARDAEGEEGKNIHGLVCDELHRWTDRDYWQALRYGGIARRNWLFYLITTAGVYDPSTLAWELHQYAEDIIADKIIDPAYYAEIWAAPKEIVDTDGILDPNIHKACNPSYGVTIDPAEMAKAAADAIRKPSERLSFCRYRLNIWTQQDDAFIDMLRWAECTAAYTEDSLRGRKCFGGLDLASKRDLAAWVLVFPPADGDERWKTLTRAWVPSETAELRELKESVPYATWGRQGHLLLTPGETIDYQTIIGQIKADASKFDVAGIAADPWMLEYFRQELSAAGIEVIEFGQNMKTFSEPTKALEELYLSGKLAHDGNPVLEWCARNTVPYTDGKDNIMPHKGKSKGKIDLIVAMVMAVGLAKVVDTGPSVYENRGLLIF